MPLVKLAHDLLRWSVGSCIWAFLCLASVTAILIAPSAANAAISQIQSLNLPGNSGSATTTATFTKTPAIGDTIIIYIWSWGGNQVAEPVISASDNYGNLYTTVEQTDTPTISGAPGYQDAAILSTIVTSTGANFQITATTARTAQVYGASVDPEIGAVAVEYSGLAGVDKYNVSPAAGGSGNPASINLGSNTSNTSELVAALVSILEPAVNFGSITPSGTPNAWVQQGVYSNNANFAAGEMASQLLTTSTNPSITWTPGSSAFQNWAAVIVSFNTDINCTSIQNGPWSSPSTWTSCNNSVPPPGGTATIAAGTSVSVDASTNTLTKITINSGGTLTSLSSGTINMGGATGPAAIINNGTLNLTAGNIALGNNLSLSGGGTWTLNNITAGTNAINATGVTSSINVVGNITGTGTFIPGSSPWSFSGTGAQTIPGSGTVTFTQLSINNSSGASGGVTMTGNVVVSTSLTLTNGALITGTNTLSYTSNCSTTPISVTNGYIFGNLSLTFPSGNVTCTYPVGNSIGYAPLTVSFTNSKGGTLIGTTQTDTGGTQESAAGLSTNASVQRYWTLTKGTITFNGNYSASMVWVNPGDLETLAVTSNFTVKYLTGGSWTSPSQSAPTGTTIQATGLTGANFGTLVVGTLNGAASIQAANFNIIDGYISLASYTPTSNHDIYTKLAGWNEATLATGQSKFYLGVAALSSTGYLLTNYVPSGTKTAALTIFDDSVAPYCNASASACSACSSSKAVSSAQTVTFTTSPDGYVSNVLVALNDTKAHPRLIAQIKDASGVYGCSTDSFSVRPMGFTVTSSTSMTSSASGSTGTPVVKAGTTFNLTASTGESTYTGTPLINYSNVTDFLGSTTPISTLFTGTFGAASAGVAVGNNFTYNEVGYVNLGTDALYDASYESQSGDLTNGDCLSGSTSNTKSSGLYGCTIGSTASSWGRFIPDYFTTAVSAQGCGIFTYSGQPIQNLQVTAYSLSGQVTKNYAGANWAKTVTLSVDNGISGTLATTGTTCTSPCVDASAFASGVASSTPAFTFASPLTAPSAIRLNATDKDGVTSPNTSEGTSTIRSGRLMINNANGSELLPLPLTAVVQYYNGTTGGWLPSTGDTCSVFTASNFAFTAYTGTGTGSPQPCQTAISVSGSPPTQTLSLSAPGSTFSGWTNITANLGATSLGSDACKATGNFSSDVGANYPWLEYNWKGAGVTNPKARATFGVARTGPVIYRRERY